MDTVEKCKPFMIFRKIWLNFLVEISTLKILYFILFYVILYYNLLISSVPATSGPKYSAPLGGAMYYRIPIGPPPRPYYRKNFYSANRSPEGPPPLGKPI